MIELIQEFESCVDRFYDTHPNQAQVEFAVTTLENLIEKHKGTVAETGLKIARDMVVAKGRIKSNGI